ncbi:outer membrane beta-barrel family protein [Rufibacter sp. LB8]|uniref:outer membrane beta-barrel family protein n=1 Tax=Rufibacter sp. LB8 TaxID=2777781 RepID=UPI00178C3A5D|nr:outer membrane beta-barrel family protein [Rufibacter sp. LB8]
MKKLSYLLFTLLLTFSLTGAHAQNTGQLTGLVVDGKGEVLSYGTAALLNARDKAFLSGTAIDLEGTFKLKTPAAGKYFFRISAIGFASQDLPVFEVTSADFSKNFGKITLQQDAKVLKEVTVENLRPTVDVQPDKMVVSVEGTAMAAGSTAYEVLAKSPGVWVDQDGNIQLNGKAGVKVMIDGKLTYLDGKQLQTMLQVMPAENLKNLEIITNPSAKFDAEGTTGILNINLKKNTLAGLNGSVYGGYLFNKEHGGNAGGNVNLKQGKWSTSATADVASRPRLRSFKMDRTFITKEGELNRQSMAGGEDGRVFSPSVRLTSDYDLNKNHSVGATVGFAQSTADMLLTTRTQTTNGFTNTLNKDENKFSNATFNVHYAGKLDTLGTTLSADVDVVSIKDNGIGTFEVKDGTTATLLENVNPTQYQIYSAKVDFARPLPGIKGKLEVGSKASLVLSDNKIDFFTLGNGTRQPSALRTGDHFLFDENIYAAYVNFNMKLSANWSLQSGLRAEYTVSEGNSKSLNKTNSRDYVDLFPSVFLQQKISENYQLSYSYSRRINRPRYENLNPAVFLIDNDTEAQGNPFLKPAYTNSFQVTQTIKKTYNLVLGYSHTKDAISEVPVPDAVNRKTVFQQRNVENKALNATLVAPLTVSTKWNISNNVTLAYQNWRTPVNNLVVTNERVMFMAQTNHNVLLPGKFKLELSGGYQGPGSFNVYRTYASYWVDLAVKKSFLKDQFDVTLAATDIFRSRKMQGMSNVDGNTNEIDMYQYAQGVRLNLRYRFNKGEKFEMKRRNTNLDEVNRAGGN